MSLFCGIDVGSTNIKVLLMDEDGRTLWAHSVPSPRINDNHGVVTDGLQLVALLEAMIIKGWRDVGGGRAIAAISTTGIGEDGFSVDDELKPLGHAIPWFDKRDLLEAVELGQSEAAEQFPAINFAFATTAAKWLWLSRHRPQELPSQSIWVTLTDYPLTWWSTTPFTSATLLPRTGIFDVFSRALVPDLAKACFAPQLPQSKNAGQSVGCVERGTLLESGAADRNTLCVAGGHDHPLASSAILRVNAGARIDSIGTANALFAETSHALPGAATVGIDLSLPVRGGPGIAALGPIEFAEPLLSAFRTEKTVRERLAVTRIEGLPSGKPPDVKQAVANQNFRRLLEGLSFQARVFLKRMALVGIAEGPIYATGGWARSRALMELRASIFGSSITAIHEPELTALGAALFAAEAAAGSCPDFMRFREVETIDPVPLWMDAYANWQTR